MKLRNLLIVSITLLGFISCNKSKDVGSSVLPPDNIIRVTAGVDALATRAGVETSNLAEFGMFIEAPVTSSYTYNNVKVTKSGTTWGTSETMLWKNESDRVLIVAYSPFNESTSLTEENLVSVMADQSTAANMIASDYLHKQSLVRPSFPTEPNNDISYDGEKVHVILSHIFSKLLLTINLGSEFTNLDDSTSPITNVSINGTYTSAKLKLKEPSRFYPLSNIKAITPFKGTYTPPTNIAGKSSAEYEAIIIPQMDAALSIDIVINNVTYSWSSTQNATFESGNSHSLTLTIGDDIVQSSAMSAGDWLAGTDGGIVTD